MTLNMLNLSTIGGNLYLSDFLDILIIALILYSLFTFVIKTRSYMVFLGLAFTGVLYFIAQIFNLYLTFLTLKYFVGVSVIIFVVIFQAEIRKYFEFLGIIGTRQIKAGIFAPKTPDTSAIVQACVQMAQTKTGALIAIQGKDNIDHLVDGGTTLDGVISDDVLTSIFDPHSDGHDGAVIIRNNRINKFGAHLPLSTNFKELKKHGTRHSAALGLSESSDALSVVVSEEKGKISICKEGKLKTLKSYEDLEKEITKFINSKFVKPPENPILRVFKHNFKFKFGALGLAMIIWFFTAFQAGIVEKTYKVPITLANIPEEVIIESYSPKEISVTVSGRGEASFADIESDDFKITYDATQLEDGLKKKTLTNKNINIPTNLTLMKFDPDSFLITSQKHFLVEVPVNAKTTGSVPEDTNLLETVLTPEYIELWVPQSNTAPSEIVTETIDISELKESVIMPVKIIIPEDTILFNGDETVNVAFTVEEKEE